MMSEGDGIRTQRQDLVSPRFRVGEWLVEPAWNRLRRDGEAVKLEPRQMRLLVTLAAEPGRPLQRDELLNAVWPDVHVNEEALSRAVSQLRKALGDDPKSPKYIATVHKGGYSLIAPTGPAAAAAEAGGSDGAAERARRVWPWAVFLFVFVTAVAALLAVSANNRPEPQALMQLIPITSDPGREIDPAVSPDGSRVAYLASIGSGYQLFVRALDGGVPLQVTRSGLAMGHPTWSPEGDRIAFVGADKNPSKAAAIYLVRASGGEAAKLVDLPSWSFGLDWSPDGRSLAFSDTAPGEIAGIAIVDVATRVVRPLTRGGDTKPVFSPDGRRLAFLRNRPLDRQQIVIVGLSGYRQAEVVATSPQQIRGLDWAPVGRSLIYSAKAGRRFGLWRVAADGGEPQALQVEGGDLFNPSVSANGHVVVEEVDQDSDLWRADLARGEASPLIRSTSDDYDPAYSPDGAHLAFVSERTGNPELWIQSGAAARRLTSFGGANIARIFWSADGTRLAFVAGDPRGTAVHVVRASGGEPIQVLRDAGGRLPIGWSADGTRLFVLAPEKADWRLEALKLEDRSLHRLNAPLLSAAGLAADRRSIWAVPAGENKLFRVTAAEGVVQQLRLPALGFPLSSVLATPDAVHLVEDALGAAIMHRVELSSGGVRAAIRLEDFRGGSIAWNPNGRSVVYAKHRETANDLAWTKL